MALRWEPTHVTKHCPRVVPLHRSQFYVDIPPNGACIPLVPELLQVAPCHRFCSSSHGYLMTWKRKLLDAIG